MLLVKTYLDKSAIHGLGVFAGEVIRRGTKVWRFVDGFDRVYSPTQFAKLPKPARDYIWNYGYRVDGEILLTIDHDHHMNHSDKANTHWHNGYIVASRTIRKGEEITNDYRQFGAGFCAAFLKRKLRVVANNPGPRDDALGCGAPVAFGRVIGRSSKVRTVRFAKVCASRVFADHPSNQTLPPACRRRVLLNPTADLLHHPTHATRPRHESPK